MPLPATPYSMYIVDSVILNSQQAAIYSCLNAAGLTTYFLVLGHSKSAPWISLDRHSILNSRINKNTQKCRHPGTKQTMKRTLMHSVKAKTRKKAKRPLVQKNVHIRRLKFSATLNICKWPQNATSTELGGCK